MLLVLQAETEKRRLAATKVKEPVTHIEKPLEENVNRLQIEGEQARSVEEAIAVLRYLPTCDIVVNSIG
jgi:DNA-binding transcriptional regulator GbsR (MarR family)